MHIPGPDGVPFNPMAYIDGFVVPQYWDGRMLGDGKPMPYTPPASDSRARLMAQGALVEYIAQGRPEPPLMVGDAYLPGSRFDAEEHPVGTIFWMNSELLSTEAPAARPITFSDEPMQHQSVPVDGKVSVQGPNWQYLSLGHWAVRTEAKRGRPLLYALSAGSLAVNAEGEIEGTDGKCWTERPAVNVGEVYHETSGGQEYLTRTLRVYRANAPTTSSRRNWPFGGITGAVRRLAEGVAGA
jgi:hypothetical protein